MALIGLGAQAEFQTLAFVAATIFGIGKTYFWPTMLGLTSEQFPKGGALLISLMGGTGMLSVAVALPIMGAKIDEMGGGAAGGGAALQMMAVLVNQNSGNRVVGKRCCLASQIVFGENQILVNPNFRSKL